MGEAVNCFKVKKNFKETSILDDLRLVLSIFVENIKFLNVLGNLFWGEGMAIIVWGLSNTSPPLH